MVSTFAPAIESAPATPAIVIDFATAERNNQRLVDYARQHNVNVRPHTKTHKSLRFGQMQMAQGCSGLTVAKVGEAEVMAKATHDLLVAYPAIDPVRTKRLAKLAGDLTLRVAVDSREGLEALAAAARQAGTTIGILVDQDVGMGRTGVPTSEITLELAKFVKQNEPALRLDGLFFYPGQVWAPADQQGPQLAAIDAILGRTLDLWKAHGFEAPIVSGGSTPTTYQSHLVTNGTETRSGTHIFNDMNTLRANFCTEQDLALGVICTIVSTAVSGKAVIDAGSKTLTSDRNVSAPDSGHGAVLEYPGAKITRLSEEHGELDLTHSERRPKIGERVTIIPNHVCPVVNLHDRLWVQEKNGELSTLSIEARGLIL